MLADVLRRIREEEPPKPSLRISDEPGALPAISAQRKMEPPRAHEGWSQGDLDWIVMKALEKDRSRRYETANGLAQDVLHYPSATSRCSRGRRRRSTGSGSSRASTGRRDRDRGVRLVLLAAPRGGEHGPRRLGEPRADAGPSGRGRRGASGTMPGRCSISSRTRCSLRRGPRDRREAWAASATIRAAIDAAEPVDRDLLRRPAARRGLDPLRGR